MNQLVVHTHWHRGDADGQVDTNIYLAMFVSLLDPECALCVCGCEFDIKLEYLAINHLIFFRPQ